MKAIIKNIPNDILYGISVILLHTLLLSIIRGVPPYFNYLFLLFSSILSIFILTPTLYLTPIYYILSRFILLFISDKKWLGGTIIALTYVSSDPSQNPFLTHNFSAPFIIYPLQDHLEYLKRVAHFQMSLPQILIITLSTLPFIFFKRKTKRLIEDPTFKTLIFLFLYGALIALPSDYLLMFLIYKGMRSVYILPITLLFFSTIPSLLINRFFPDIIDKRIIFIPIVSLFFFYLIITGGTILLFTLFLFDGLISMFILAFPYFEMPLIFSGILAYVYIKKISKKSSH